MRLESVLFTQHRCLVLDVMSISLLETAEPDPIVKLLLLLPLLLLLSRFSCVQLCATP